MLDHVDVLLVIGSRNSSNSNRLVEVAQAAGVPAYLIDDESDIDESWFDGVDPSGVTSGASAPERLVERVCTWFCANGVEQIEPYQLVDEDVTFRLPSSCGASSRSPSHSPSERRSSELATRAMFRLPLTA